MSKLVVKQERVEDTQQTQKQPLSLEGSCLFSYFLSYWQQVLLGGGGGTSSEATQLWIEISCLF